MPWSGLSHRVGLHEVVGLHQVDVEVDGAAEDGGEVGHLGQVSHQLRKLRVQLGLKHCVFLSFVPATTENQLRNIKIFSS